MGQGDLGIAALPEAVSSGEGGAFDALGQADVGGPVRVEAARVTYPVALTFAARGALRAMMAPCVTSPSSSVLP